MEALRATGTFTVDDRTYKMLRTEFVGGWISDSESLGTVRRCWQNHRYLVDPHTAVALEVALQTKGENPVLVVATAHWAKFAPNVLRALLGLDGDEPLPLPYAAHSDFETVDDVLALAPGCAPVPEPIERLRSAPVLFKDVIDATPDAIRSAVQGWLDSR
jgi:threonine synthase